LNVKAHPSGFVSLRLILNAVHLIEPRVLIKSCRTAYTKKSAYEESGLYRAGIDEF